MRNWYRKGADVPEQLSRFLFLEEALPGRRVLYIGAAGSELEEALVELGAKSVVCLPDPNETTISEPSNESKQTMWPGPAGTFDLIVDFGLAAAVERGDDWRLAEIERLLSEDGFALAAWNTGESPGLARFFDGPQHASLQQAPRDGMAYGDWVRLLLDRFELVEVYFQTLLLGYFFGSFELDTSDDGIAPHTGLMGTEPEPAAHYLFAFGNAVPFLQDASLVQLPLLDVYRNWENDGRTRAPKQDDEAVLSASIPVADATPGALLPMLKRDDLVGMCAELEEKARTRNQELRRLDHEKEAAITTLHELEKELRRSLDLHAEAEQRNVSFQQELEALRDKLAAAEAKLSELRLAEENDASGHQRWQDERERLRHRARLLEERMQALQAKLENVSEERDQAREEAGLLGEELDAHAHRKVVATSSRVRAETAPASLDDSSIGGASFEASLQQAEASFEAEAASMASASEALLREKEAALARLAKGVNTLVEERAQQQMAWETERARYESALSTEKERASQLTEENAALSSQLQQLQARFAEISQDSHANQSQVSALRQRAEKAEAASLELDSRLRSAQAAVESRSRQMGVAQQAFHEAAAQRDTLQRVLETRDQEATSLREELASALAELERFRQAEQAASLWQDDVATQTMPRAGAGVDEHALSELSALRSTVEMQAELLREARREHAEVRDAYDMTQVLLEEARSEFARVSGNNELAKALLDEARKDHGRVSAESALMRTLLEEARASHDKVQAEAELAAALLEEARDAHQSPRHGSFGEATFPSAAHETERPVSVLAAADAAATSLDSTVDAREEAATQAEPPTPS